MLSKGSYCIALIDRTLVIRNFVKCYQHEICFGSTMGNGEIILNCKTTWKFIYVLFNDGHIVRIPWKENLSVEHFLMLHYKDRFHWTGVGVTSITVSTVKLPDSERFSPQTMNCIKNKLLSENDCPNFLIGCTDRYTYFIDNESVTLYRVDDDNDPDQEPVNIPLINLSPSVKIRAICCGKGHTVLLTSFGTVLTFGAGTKGELGHGSTDCETQPRLVEALLGLKIKCISTGGWHTAALTGLLYLFKK